MNKSANILVLDDQPLIGYSLKSYLANIGYHSVTVFTSGNEVIHSINPQDFDLGFVDIELNDKYNGIDVANFLSKNGVQVVFVSSFEDAQTISDATAINPLAYIVKPFKESNILIALNLFKNSEKLRKKATLIDGKKNHTLHLEKVIYAQSETPYVRIVMTNRKLLVRLSLKTVLTSLSDSRFIQIHKSFVVNKEHIECINVRSVLINGKELPLSPKYKGNLKNKEASTHEIVKTF